MQLRKEASNVFHLHLETWHIYTHTAQTTTGNIWNTTEHLGTWLDTPQSLYKCVQQPYSNKNFIDMHFKTEFIKKGKTVLSNPGQIIQLK